MQHPQRLPDDQTVIEKYGRKVELAYFREPLSGTVSEWLLFSSKQTPVVVFPLTEDGKVIATRQFRYGINQAVLELPGGLIEDGETEQQAMCREVEEETGYCAQSWKKLENGVWFDPCCYGEMFLPYLATRCLKKTEPVAAHTAVELYSIKDWYRLCVTGSVMDSKSLAISLLALPELRAIGKSFDVLNGLTV